MRTIESSVSNKNVAKVLHNSVLPTPVGPKNRNEPLGRFGSAKPARERRTALATAATASDWPITRLCNSLSMRNNFSRSPSSIFEIGMPVHFDTTSAISSSVTLLRNNVMSCISACPAISSFFSSSGIIPYCNSDMRAKSLARRAESRSCRACSNWLLIPCEPCNAAFSARQISSKSEYAFSISLICV